MSEPETLVDLILFGPRRKIGSPKRKGAMMSEPLILTPRPSYEAARKTLLTKERVKEIILLYLKHRDREMCTYESALSRTIQDMKERDALGEESPK